MAARTSSAEGGAPAEYSPAAAGLRDYLETWKGRLAETGWAPWLILGLAAFLRFFLLGIKPPHFDEGINGWFVDQVMHNGFYRYDPTNYHGPLHFYVLLFSESLFGRNVWALRLPVVLVSISCIWLMLKFEPLVGRNVSRIAALTMAVSPGFVFYGRYAIHEVWLQFFSTMFILGLLGLWKSGRVNYLWYAGMGMAGMILTKETYAIHVVCAVIAIPVLMVSHALNRVPDAK
ncbi:MAG TPA: glycosyltransferase family 39 protein, partial [Candidatus Udaeobacter sp.]|nr:glycosyltransferase family 39 protein [Candidatus Udaeobacter sp.]